MELTEKMQTYDHEWINVGVDVIKDHVDQPHRVNWKLWFSTDSPDTKNWNQNDEKNNGSWGGGETIRV